MGGGRDGVRESNERGWMDQSKYTQSGWETTLSIDLGINN
jgi:hypothetical protein